MTLCYRANARPNLHTPNINQTPNLDGTSTTLPFTKSNETENYLTRTMALSDDDINIYNPSQRKPSKKKRT